MRESTPSPTPSTEREILPKSLKPVHYDLRFEPHLEEAIEYDGSVAIEILVLEDTSSITINAIELDILSTEVWSSDQDALKVSGISFDKAKERMTIELASRLAKGSSVTLKQTFKGSLLHQALGFFRAPYKGTDGKPKWMAATLAEPADARKIFPCFDEPALKATFSVTLVVEKHLTALGNMDVLSTKDAISHGKEKKAVSFNKTPPMSTYIVAFAVGEFNFIETNAFRVPVRIYAVIDKNIEHGRMALELAPRTLAAFEQIFDVDFPLPKMDLIAVPGNAGGMENWGLVVFGEPYLLVDEDESSAQAYRTAASVLVHELAHQWFGNLVTMDFWEGLWLNESFADWAELYAWDTLDPEWMMWNNYAVGGYQLGLALDSNKASHPIEVPVNSVGEINQIFDDISYNKGCAVVRMIAGFVGTEKFVEGVRLYLKKHAYGNTKTSDLWDALSHVSGKDVGSVMESWTKHMGYPVVEVNEEGDNLVLTQHRFIQDGSLTPEDDQVLYPLSLQIRTKDGIDGEVSLHERTKTIKAPEFFKLNADQTGFFRVSYTPERLSVLRQNARDGLLSPNDRIGLLSDAVALARSGNSKTSTVLGLLEAFEDEDNFFVWKQIQSTLGAITDAWEFEEPWVIEALESFQTRLFRKCLKRKGWEFKPEDDKVEQMFKALIFSCSGDDKDVQKAAAEMFSAFVDGDEKTINVNIRSAVFGITLEHGGTKEYEAVLKAAEKANSIDKTNTCLLALGNTHKADLLSRTLDFAISPTVISQGISLWVIKSLTRHRLGKQAVWKWFRENFDEIHQKIGDSLGRFARGVSICVEPLSTRDQWEEARKFFQGKDTETYKAYLAQSLDTVLAKVRWVERDRDDVAEWLKAKGYSAAGKGGN